MASSLGSPALAQVEGCRGETSSLKSSLKNPTISAIMGQLPTG